MTFASEVAADSPYIWWDTRQASGASQPDRSGNGRTGTITGSPTASVDGLTFDNTSTGDDQWIVSDDDLAAGTYPDWTVEAVVRRSGIENFYEHVFGVSDTAAVVQILVAANHFLSSYNYYDGYWYDGTTSHQAGFATSPVTDADLHHLAFTYDGSTSVLYVDGAEYHSQSLSGKSAVLATSLPFFLGDDLTGGGDGFNGLIRHGIFYDHALDGTRIAAHASAALADDPFPTPPAPPVVTDVTPDAGTADGGTSVTITGTGFTGATGVLFGATGASSFTVDSDTTITAVTPAHSHISVHVTVTTPVGTSDTSSDDVFSFTGDRPAPPDPITIRVIDIDGNPHTASGLTDGELPLARCISITRTPNAPKEAQIAFPKYAYTRDDVHLFADDSGSGDLHLIEVVRNSIVRFRGVAVVADGKSSDGEVTLHCYGLDWILGRRYLDGQRTNELLNPSFESGDDSGWSDFGALTSTVTTDDAVRGTYSLRLESLTPLGDIYKTQTMSIHGTGVGTFVTIVCYFKLESIGGHALDRRGLYVEARDGADLKANNFYAIDEATPTGEWIRAKTTIGILPLQTWDVEVRLYSPPGSILWDDGQVVAMQSISTATITGNTFETVDVSEIVGLILDHVQDPAVGKSDLHLGLDNPTVGVKQVKHIQWADHVAWSDQMSEWLDRDDCFDYAIRTNLDGTNELALLVPYAGTDRRSTVTLTFPEGNIASFEFTEDGGGTITDDTELDDDTGDGPDREEGHYADASLIGGLTLQSINSAPTKSEPSSLDPLAREKVKKARRPARLIKATLNGAQLLSGTPYDELLGIGDRVTLAVDAGWIAVADEGRISQLTEYPSDRRLEVTVAVAI